MELGVIRNALRIQPDGTPGKTAGAIERVASIVLNTVQGSRLAAVKAGQP